MSQKNRKDLHKTLEKLDKVSPSFCLAKWKNSTIHLHNGHTQSCHHVASHSFGSSITAPDQLHNTPKKIQARQQMLQGKQPPECEYCWKVERHAAFSDRVHKSAENVYLDYFDEVISSGEGQHIQPSFLELAFDNNCQFRCMYCNPAYSSQWEKEIKEHGQYSTWGNRINQFYNRSRLPLEKSKRQHNIELFWQWWPQLKKHLRYLRVTGGEPLLSSDFKRLIKHLIENPCPDLRFAINTNFGFSGKPMDDFLSQVERLQQATQEVLLFTSIDTMGEQAEYIRYGLDTHSFFQNIHRVLQNQSRPLTLCFMVTVNVLSLPGTLHLLKTIHDIKLKYPFHQISIDTPYLRQPEHLSVEILTPDFRHFIQQTVEWLESDSSFSEAEIEKVRRIIPLVSNSKQNPAKTFLLRQDFYKFIEQYDQRKGTHFHNTFPEYSDFMKLCRSAKNNFQDLFLRT